MNAPTYLTLRIPFPKASTLAQHGRYSGSRGLAMCAEVWMPCSLAHMKEVTGAWCHTSPFGQGHQRKSHTRLVIHTHGPVATETGSATPAAAPAYGLQRQAGF